MTECSNDRNEWGGCWGRGGLLCGGPRDGMAVPEGPRGQCVVEVVVGVLYDAGSGGDSSDRFIDVVGVEVVERVGGFAGGAVFIQYATILS